jgi:hypothetical protein
LQRLALRTKGWFVVVTAGLAGNAVTDSLWDSRTRLLVLAWAFMRLARTR